MKNNMLLRSVAFISVFLILFLILVSSAATAQSASSVKTYAYITNSGDGTVSVIDTTTNQVIYTIPDVGPYPWGVAVTSDGKRVYVTNKGYSTVSVIDTASKTVIDTFTSIYGTSGVAVTPDGGKVYVTGDSAAVFDTATKNIAYFDLVADPVGVATSPDGKKVYIANRGLDTVSVFDTETNTILTSIPVGAQPYGIAVTPDGKKVYVTNFASDPSTVSVINTSTNKVIATVPVLVPWGGHLPMGVAVTPDGKKVYVSGYNSQNVSVIDTVTDNITATVDLGYGGGYCGVSVTPDGKKVYVAENGGNTVSVIDTTKDTVADKVIVGMNPAAFGQFIGSVLAQATPIITWSNPYDMVYGIPLSSTQLNAVSSVPGSFVYNPPTGTVLNVGTQTLHVDFIPDDENYISASQDVTINVLTPVQKIQQMITMVKSLDLKKVQTGILIVPLDAATRNLNAGNKNVATVKLKAFIVLIKADINSGILSSTEGQALIDAAKAVISAL